jgi:hypothetical protein
MFFRSFMLGFFSFYLIDKRIIKRMSFISLNNR